MPASKKKKKVTSSEGIEDNNENQDDNTTIGSLKRRQTANSFQNITMSLEERIATTIYQLYANDDDKSVDPLALCNIAKELGLEKSILPPKYPQLLRKKITVLLCGNHSSGKSSFINWYVGEHVQKTGVAIETQRITFVRNGKRRETLEGPATIKLYPQLQDIVSEKGLLENLCTELSISTERKFSLVNFVDSPGLVDGTTNYPFDVEKVIKHLASMADLILIFFDPHGQALCKRTMNVVDQLNKEHQEKCHFFLSKADDIKNPHDLHKVVVQITQNLAVVVRNKSFNLQTIYLPREGTESCTVPNSINDICTEIEKTINLNLQRMLNQLESDVVAIDKRIDTILKTEENKRKQNVQARNRGLCFSMLGALFPVLFALAFTHHLLAGVSADHFLYSVASALIVVGQFTQEHLVPENKLYALLAVIAGFLFFGLLSKLVWKPQPVLNKKEISRLKDIQKHVTTNVMKTKQELYQQYVHQFI